MCLVSSYVTSFKLLGANDEEDEERLLKFVKENYTNDSDVMACIIIERDSGYLKIRLDKNALKKVYEDDIFRIKVNSTMKYLKEVIKELEINK